MPPESSSPAAMDSRRKAAIVVQALLAAGDRPPLAGLPDAAQAQLAREMGRLAVVDRATLHAVATELADRIEGVGVAGPRGIAGALAALDTHISPEVVARLRAEAGRITGDPWVLVAQLAPERLAAILLAESVEVAAVILAKLPVARAAEALGCLPGERARRVAFAVSRTSGVAPATVRLIGQAIAREHCEEAVPAFPAPPAERVGAILNSSAATTRSDVLDGLDGADRDFALGVRKAIFTFAHVRSRLNGADVPRVLRGLAPRLLAQAIVAARGGTPEDAASADFILASLPQRLGDSLREEMELMGAVRPKDGEAAQAAVVSTIRDAAAGSEIELVEQEDAAA